MYLNHRWSIQIINQTYQLIMVRQIFLLLQNFISLVLSCQSNLFDFALCFSTGESAAVSHSVSSYGRVLVSGPAIIRANPTVSLFKV